MVKFAAFALVALVAFQACSARHVLKASSAVVDDTYEAAFEIMDNTAGDLIGAVYGASLDFTNLVQTVESAVDLEEVDPELYGDPEVAAKKALADIDSTVTARAERFSAVTDAANTQITDLVAQASAGVQDASVTAMLTLIQQKYSAALDAILDVANDFSDNAADVARDAINARPDMNSVRTMEKLRGEFKLTSKSIERKINKASEQIDAAILADTN